MPAIPATQEEANQEDRSLKPVLGKQFVSPYMEIANTQKGWLIW
jgi:hypothetical protein